MIRNFFTGKREPLAKFKGRLNTVSLAALSALGIAGVASAQDAAQEMVPDGFQAIEKIKDFESVTIQTDGSVEVVLASGETATFAAAEIAVVGGHVFVAETAIAAAGLSVASGIGTLAIIAGGAAIVGGAVAISESGGGDSNDAPIFSSPSTVSVSEGQTSVFTASATDADGDALTYMLSGTDASLFTINGSTGAVSFIDAPNFETPGDSGGDNIFNVTVTASDGDLSTSQDVAITVTSGPAFTAAENQTAAFTATASDVDGDALTYTLSGTDAALFAIDAATGVVSFLETPDFETPGDADEDNVYDVTVTASDGDLSTSQDVAITLRSQ